MIPKTGQGTKTLGLTGVDAQKLRETNIDQEIAQSIEPDVKRQTTPGADQDAVGRIRKLPGGEEALRRFEGVSREKLNKAIDQTGVSVDFVARAFRGLLYRLPSIGDPIDVRDLDEREAGGKLYYLKSARQAIQAVQKGLSALGSDAAGQLSFHAQVDVLAHNVEHDIGLLEAKLRGEIAPRPPEPGVTRANDFLAEIPGSVRRTSANIPDVTAAIGVIGELLGDALAKKVETVLPKVGDRAGFERAIQAYAILAADASTCVSFLDTGPIMMGRGVNLSEYVGRSLGARLAGSSERRQLADKALLAEMLDASLSGAQVDKAVPKALGQAFVAMVGLDPAIAKTWKPDAAGIIQALDDNGLIALRAAAELPYTRMARPDPTTLERRREVLIELTQAVVEGRYEEWRAGHPRGKAQLAHLQPEQQEAWLESHEKIIERPDGSKIRVREPRGLERMFVGRLNPGGSHSFDFLPRCALDPTANAYTTAIIAEESNQGTPTARAYLRLFENADTGEPVILLEGSSMNPEISRAFRPPDEIADAIRQYAQEKASAVGAQLVEVGRTRLPPLRIKPAHPFLASDALSRLGLPEFFHDGIVDHELVSRPR